MNDIDGGMNPCASRTVPRSAAMADSQGSLPRRNLVVISQAVAALTNTALLSSAIAVRAGRKPGGGCAVALLACGKDVPPGRRKAPPGGVDGRVNHRVKPGGDGPPGHDGRGLVRRVAVPKRELLGPL